MQNKKGDPKWVTFFVVGFNTLFLFAGSSTVFHVLHFFSQILSEVFQVLHTFPYAGTSSRITFLVELFEIAFQGHY